MLKIFLASFFISLPAFAYSGVYNCEGNHTAASLTVNTGETVSVIYENNLSEKSRGIFAGEKNNALVYDLVDFLTEKKSFSVQLPVNFYDYDVFTGDLVSVEKLDTGYSKRVTEFLLCTSVGI